MTKLTGDPVHIMVIHEIIEEQILINPLGSGLPVQAVGNFKVVVIQQAGPEPFIAFIIRDRVQSLRIDPLAIIPVDHLTQQPEIRPA